MLLPNDTRIPQPTSTPPDSSPTQQLNPTESQTNQEFITDDEPNLITISSDTSHSTHGSIQDTTPIQTSAESSLPAAHDLTRSIPSSPQSAQHISPLNIPTTTESFPSTADHDLTVSLSSAPPAHSMMTRSQRGSTATLVSNFILLLSSEFAIKDLGPIHHFLGMEITPIADALHLSQSHYAFTILERSQMIDCKPMGTPLEAKTKTPSNDVPMEDPSYYRGIVGDLHFMVSSTAVSEDSVAVLGCRWMLKLGHDAGAKRRGNGGWLADELAIEDDGNASCQN
ncbi:hypothetical protein SADUNF_Sadunf11G0020500 [Salix dunnii]|uniref:Reverse transcriptase Ty1/copia-type domain-containing protein n=1 Tax=Salix dunnii TaxID=1413687 RepID=A0A835JN61_9ROSI|nr:hypothetical protein SADUNF_Sadunf11G0020500 [Salix dunnii]